MEHFKQLREKYNNRTATHEERLEYYRLIRSGQYEDADFDEIRASLDEHDMPTPQETAMLEEVRAGILGDNSKTRNLNTARPWFAAAAAIVLLAIAGLWAYRTMMENSTGTTNIRLVNGPAYVRLPDESTVLIKAGSWIKYNESTFGKTSRNIDLSGEAFFDVSHNAAIPFIAQAEKVFTKVLGTAFNISADPKHVQVTVVRGRVMVMDSTHTFETILPNEQITVVSGSHEYVKRHVKAEQAVAWKNETVVFDGITLEEAVRQLEQKFAVEITIENEELKSCRVSAWFVRNENALEILEPMAAVREATVEAQGNQIAIKGGRCPQP